MLDATRALHAAAMGNPGTTRSGIAPIRRRTFGGWTVREGKTLNTKGLPGVRDGAVGFDYHGAYAPRRPEAETPGDGA
jgi:hypothetical protein